MEYRYEYQVVNSLEDLNRLGQEGWRVKHALMPDGSGRQKYLTELITGRTEGGVTFMKGVEPID